MSEPIILVENISKRYYLGAINRKTLTDEVKYGWLKLRGKEPAEHMGKVRAGAWKNVGNPEFWALKDVSFEVQQGEILGVIGRNGAGKSTLFKILSRITEPTTGRAVINGRVGSLLEVGTGFHPELTGRENVFMNGTILGMKRREIEAKFDEIVAFSEIEKFIDTPVKRYSSGMYVRLAFAVAAHLEPEVLFVDEVLAVGDASFRRKCLEKMGDVAREGRTVLFISHQVAALEALCTRCILLKDGQVDFSGDIKEGVARHLKAMVGASKKEMSTRKENRKGNGAARVVHLGVEGQDPGLQNTVLCGEDVVFRIRYLVKRALVRPALRFTIYGLDGQGLCTFETESSHFSLAGELGEHQIICGVERFILAPGDYMVNVELSETLGIVDLVHSAFSFTVLPRDVRKGSHAASSKEEAVVFAADWKPG